MGPVAASLKLKTLNDSPYRMHSGWPFSLHTPFTGPLGIEPNIDYQLLPGRKPGVFTDVYKFAQDKNFGRIYFS